MAIQIHESRKADEMYFVGKNDPSPANMFFEKKKKRDQARNEKIRCLTEKLHKGVLTTEGFMREMASDKDGLWKFTDYDSDEELMDIDEE